jgi:predicted ATPase
MAIKGYAAPEVEHTYSRARELCRRMRETPQLVPALMGLRIFYAVRGELQTSRELAEQLLRLAQRVQDPALLLEAHRSLGVTLFWLGELAPARRYMERVITLYDPQQHRSHAFLYGQDPGVTCLATAAHILWLLGYPDQALRKNHEALTQAQALAHPFSLAYALTFGAACLHQYRREEQAVQERAEDGIALASEQGFSMFSALGIVLRGWALAGRGQVEEGLTQLRQGLAAFRATGAEMLRPYFLILLAEAYEKVGQREEGRAVLTEALAAVHGTGVRFCEAELYRLYGELSLRLGERESGRWGDNTAFAQSPSHLVALSSPEECFHKAIEIARKQQAKSLELRAVMSLARLWQQQSKQADAHRMLSEIYNWFTEGFDTKDLQEAKTLLEKLKDRVERNA